MPDPTIPEAVTTGAASGGAGGILGAILTYLTITSKFASKEQIDEVKAENEASVSKLEAKIAEKYVSNDRLEAIVASIQRDFADLKEDTRRILTRLDQLADRNSK